MSDDAAFLLLVIGLFMGLPLWSIANKLGRLINLAEKGRR